MWNTLQLRIGGSLRLSVLAKFICLPALAMLSTNTMAGGKLSFDKVFEGSGRACYGKLVVTSKEISWITPFSKCKKLPYEFTDLGKNEGCQQFLYQIKKKDRACLYNTILLSRKDDPKLDSIWEAIGYRTIDDYKFHKVENSLSCGLVQIK